MIQRSRFSLVPQTRPENVFDQPQRFNGGHGRGVPRMPFRQSSRGIPFQPMPSDTHFNPYAAPFVPGVGVVPNPEVGNNVSSIPRSFNGRGRQRQSVANVQQMPASFIRGVPRDDNFGNIKHQYRKPQQYGIAGVNPTRGN
ncbi:unnamed protein product, partial [Strongylus vulgaris]